MTRQFTPATSDPVRTIAHDQADVTSLTIPDASLLFSAEFKRSGSDLVLVGSSGQKFIVVDYFRFEKRPDLVAGDGAVLSAKVVESLAVSNAPTQYAQATAPSPTVQVIGKVEKVTGSVTAIRNGVAVTLNAGDALNKTDIVQTGSNSNVGISLLDGTALNLSANTRMALNEFNFDVNASTGNAGHLTLVQGAFAFVSGLVASTGGLNIETPVANIGIRGTVGGATCTSAGRCEYYAGQEIAGPKTGEPSTFTLQTGGRYVNGQYVGGTAIASVTVGANAQVSATGVNTPPQVTFVPAAAADPGLSALSQQLIQVFPQFTPGPAGPQGPQAPQGPQVPQAPPSPNPQSGPSPGSSTPPTPDSGGPDSHPPLTSIPPPIQTALTTVNFTPPPDITPTASSTSGATADAIILQTSTPPPPPSGTISTTISTDTGQAPTIASGGVTKDNTPTLSGSVSSGIVSVQIMDGPSDLGAATIDGSGSWNFTTTPLSDGPHAFTAVATDTDGNTTNAGPVAAIIDTASPAAPVITTTAPPINNAPSIDIAGTAEPNSTVTLYNGASVVGTATTNGSGNWHIDGIALTGGATYNFTATATDEAGNTSDPSNALAFQENNAPAIQNVGGTETVAEDGSVLLQGGPIASVTDADGDTLTMTVSVAHGTLTASQAILDAITAGALTAIDGNGSDGSLTVSGSASAITAAIQAGVTYAPATNFNGADTLDVEVTDGHAIENASVAITVTPVNDAPQGANSTIATLEDTARTLPAIDFGFSDPNDGPANTLQAVKITTLPGAGTLTDNNVAVTAGQFVSLADINAGLLKFTPAANANGNDYASFTFQVQDNGGTANGGVDLDPTPNTITINVTPVNDAPTVANAIADQNATQGSAYLFQFAANTFNDVDVGDTLTYTATLSNDTPLPAWLSFNAVTRTFSGTPGAGDVGTITVKVTATDGSSASVSDIFDIVVGNTNDAPVLNAGATPVLTVENEDAGVPVGAVGTLVSSLVNLNPPAGGLDNVTDADSGALTGIALTATNTTNGTWFYSTNNGSSWTAVGAVTDGAALLLAADANTRLYFQPNANFNGTINSAITFRAWDQSSGTAGTKVDTAPNGGTTAFSTATDTADIIINAVNDAPVNTVPAATLTVNEDSALNFSGPNTISVNDVDGNLATTQLTVLHGTLTVSLAGGATISAGANGSNTLTLSGTQGQINAALATLSYQGVANFNGSDTLTVLSTDGASSTDSDIINITVNTVNDAPTLTATAVSPTFTEAAGAATQAPAVSVFSGANASTIEAGQTIKGLSFTVSGLADGANEKIVVDGTAITLGGNSSGTTTTNAMSYSVTVVGGTAIVALSSAGGVSASAINALVNGITYQDTNTDNPTAGSRIFTLTQIQDSGGTANSGVDSTALSLASTVTVVAVNDAPVIDLLNVVGVQATATTASFAENGGAVTVAPQLTLSDVDGSTLNGATVALSGPQAGDVLSLQGQAGTSGTLTGGITFTIVGATITFGSAASLADYQAALHLVQFNNPTVNPSTADRVFTFQVNDDGGVNNTASATATVTVGTVNHAPVVTVPGSSVSLNEDGSVPLTNATVSDVDSGNILTATINVAHGTLTSLATALQLSQLANPPTGNGTGLLTITGSVSAVNAVVNAGVTYTPAANFNGQDQLTLSVADNFGGSDSKQVTITVTPVNDAPVASGGATLAAINEDTVNPPGATVSSLFSGNFSDTTDNVPSGSSANTFAGIAVSSYTVDASKGAWQYSADNGSNWTALGSATTTSAITLNGSDLLRFVPATNYNGAATALSANLIESGGPAISSGAVVNLSGATGGTTHISSGTVALSETITAVNDAPINTVPAATLTVNEDSALNFSGPNTISVNDVDGNLATTQLTVLHGTLTVSLAGGATISAGANGSNTLTLSGTQGQINAALATLSYQGVANFNGSDTLTVLSTDGASSTDSDIINITVNTVNDAPVLDASKSPVIGSIGEDAPAPVGISVGNLVSGNVVNLNQAAGNVTDPDNGALTGIAIIGTNSANGNWFYTTDNGNNWIAVGSVSNTSALLLNADVNTKLYFQPNANFNGTISDAITFRAWDRTSGTAGNKVDVSVNGSSTAFSSAFDTASFVVNPANDAPVASGGATLPVINEDTANPPGATVSSLFSGNFSDAADNVPGGSSANSFAGIAVSSYTVDATKGNWQYSTNGGSSWTALASATTIAAITLNGSDLLRFVPAANYNGAATALSANLIESGGPAISSGAVVNLSGATGATTHISSGTVALSETITAVNDAPDTAAASGSGGEDTTITVSLSGSDVDGSVASFKITSLPVHGTLYADAGLTDTLLVGESVAASGNAATVYFKPNLNYNGSDSFTYAAVDNNGTQDATPATASITVNAVNDAPAVANAIADQNATQGSAFSFQFALNTFNDVDVGDTLTYTATLDTNAPLPAWLSFNASTRTFSGTPGAGDVSTITVKVTATDGSSASVSDIFNIVVGNTNDAPVLNAGATPVLAAENEDAGAPVGAVGTLVSSLVNLNPPAGGLDNVTDADSGALTGIALTATNTTNGTWFYSTNNGSSWTAVGAVADNSALLLAADANTRLYFQPNANFNGTINSAITFRAWDQSSGTAGTKVDTAPNGGTTAFSTATDTTDITITSVADAPVVQLIDTLTRVSVPDDVVSGIVPGTDSLAEHAIAPDINGEGRYVVFFSTESVPTQGGNNESPDGDIFLYDRLTDETKILTDTTHIPLGLRENGERFSGFSISGDGRYVVFTGNYTVIDQFGSRQVNKVYVYDREFDQVTLLTDKVTHATITADDVPQINGNGSLIALVRHDNTGVDHVSVYSRDGSQFTDITAAHVDISDTLNHFQNAAISNDGRYVTFWAYAQDINFQPTGIATLYLFDRQANTATVVGTSTAGDDLWEGSLSRDGHYIVFQSDQNLDGSDSNGKIDIYVYDTVTHTRQRVSTDSVGTSANDDSVRPSISPDGRFVTFASNATNLVPGDTNGQPDTFVKEWQTGAIERVSVAVDGTQGNGDSSLASSISGGGVGAFIAFGSAASNLVPGDDNSASDVFVLDRSGGTAGQVTEDSSVTPAGTLTTHGSFAFSDVELTDAHTATVTNVSVSVSGGASTDFIVPGGLGTFLPAIVENTGDADPFGQLSWSFTIDNSALALLDSGQRVQQTYTIEIDDGHGGVTPQNVTLTLVGVTDQPTLTMQVLTPTGVFAPSDEPIGQMGSGTVQPGGTSTQFTIVNTSANRKFVFDGYGFTFDGSNAPTDGLITAIHEFTNDTTAPLVNFSGIGVDAKDWYDAVVAAANGPDTLINALTSSWAFNFVGAGGPDNFVGGNQNDTASGGDGDDFLLGSAGNDSLSGGNGNDTLGGGVGSDQLNGGGGQDLAIYFHPTEGDANVVGPINVQLAAGTVTTVDNLDTLRSIERVVGTNSDDIFNATGFGPGSINGGSVGVGGAADGTLNEFEGLDGDDSITGNGNTRVSYEHALAGVTVAFSAFGMGTAHGTGPADAGIGNDTFVSGVNRVRGSNFADNFTGSNNPTGTAEFFEGRGGDDFIDGGDGLDAAIYGNEIAGINVQLAAGTVVVGPGTQTDTLRSIEWISGSNSVDVFNATGFTTVATVPLPNAGSAGVDGFGNAFNRFEGRGGDDIITGNGNTQISFDNALAGVTVTFTSSGAGTSHGTAPGDIANVGIDTFTGVRGVRGSEFDDFIGPDIGNNNYDGRDGNDVMQGGAGNDSLTGGSGIDRAIYTDATGPITVDMAAASNNVIGAGIGSDTLSSVESIRGSASGDSYTATGYAGASAVGSLTPNFNEFEGMGGDDSITGNGNTAVSYVNAAARVTVDLSFTTVSGSTGQAQGTDLGDIANIGTDTFFGGVQFVRGSSFDDAIEGSDNFFSAPEVFEGRAGNDFINGLGGFDRVLYEFRLDDVTTSGVVINLAAGTVVGDSSIGTDTLRSIEAARGTRFADVFDATGFTSVPTVSLPNAGSAGVNNTGAAFNEFDGLGGDDLIIGNGNTRISYINATAGVTVDLAFGTAVGDASVGHDTITGGVNSIIGSNFSDTLYGTSNFTQFTSETFDGAAGNDIIVGRGGFDIAVYNGDTGTVSGITVNMAAGTVIGDASIGSDILSSIESIRGTNFNDIYVAAGFNGASDDLPLGTTFNEFEGMDGDDSITGNGNTRISYSNASAAVTVDLVNGTAHGTASGDAANVGTDAILGGVTRVIGSNFNDTIIGDGNNNVIEGLGGNDALDGGGGNDTVSYSRAPGGVTVNLNDPSPQNTVQAGTDTLSNFENVVGSNFGDHITGDNNANILDGGGGNGGDQLTGLGGADTFVFRSGFLTITDFNQGEGDLIDIRALNGGAHIENAQLDALIAASAGNQLDLGNGNVIELTGIDVHTQLSAANFIHT